MGKGAWLFLVCVTCGLFTGVYTWVSLSRAAGLVRDDSLPPVVGGLSSEPEVPVVQTFAPAPRDSPVELDTTSVTALPGISAPTGDRPAVEPVDVSSGWRDPAQVNRQPRVLLRHLGLDRSFGFLAVDPGDQLQGARQATTLSCHRVHFAMGRGVCLAVERRFFTMYTAVLFDAAFQPTHTLPLNGIPSRTRLSPDGRYAAITVFVAGHSYSEGRFATETSIVDMEAGTLLVANLEEFDVRRDGQSFSELDFNFWGVTFAANGNRFYATLSTGGVFYLVEGDIAARRAYIVSDGIECPSLSPDETRVAFKKRLSPGGRVSWQLSVLDLATLKAMPLAETRSVDDQVEWLDDDRVLYELPDEVGSATANVWVVPSDGTGRPEVFLENAASPAVVRVVGTSVS